MLISTDTLIAGFSAFVALGGFVVAIVSLVKSSKISELQARVAKLDEALKEYELATLEEGRSACVKVRLIKVGEHRHLRFWNDGKETAYDVDYVVPDELRGLIFRRKAPFAFLEHLGSFDESLVTYFGIPSAFEVITKWRDAKGEEHTRKNMVSL